MLLLALTKKLVLLDRRMREGHWTAPREMREVLPPTPPVYGERLGLVGFGSIARNVALKAQAFGLHVSAYDPLIDSAVFQAQGVTQAALDKVLTQSDYVSLHVPLTSDTRHLMNAERLRSMKPTAFLINTSRGGVIDEPALIHALQEGWISGVGLDVFAQEPLPAYSPLLKMDNVIVTPHTASYSEASRVRVRRRVAEEAARIARGEWPTALANPQVKGRSRFEQRLATN
jgi:phosphoglycerate dehydrogenase-like enzyme